MLELGEGGDVMGGIVVSWKVGSSGIVAGLYEKFTIPVAAEVTFV